MNQIDNSNCRERNSFCNCLSFICIIPIALLSLFAIAILFYNTIFSTSTLEGAQVQLQGDTLIIENDETIVFDTVITDNSASIAYDNSTGQITVTESGTYYVNWWFSVDGSPGATTIDLTIVTSTGETITASSPILSGQMSGNALLDLAASPGAPVTIELVNTTGNQIFAGATSVRADLTIIRANS